MDIPGKKITITPVCVENHGIENRVDFAFKLLRDNIIRSLKAFPEQDVVVTYFIKELAQIMNKDLVIRDHQFGMDRRNWNRLNSTNE